MRIHPTEDEPTERHSAPEHEAVPKVLPAAAHAKRRPGTVVLVFAIVAILLGLLWWVNHRQNPQGSGATGQGGGRGRFAASGPQPVTTRTARSEDLNIYLEGLGTVTPLANVTVRTQITGQLMQIAFKEGQMVNQGDLLVVIDPRPYDVALKQAEGQLVQAQAQLKEAQLDLARYLKLSQEDSIAMQTVDAQRALVNQYEGLVETDEAAIASAKLNLVYCHITAPVTGRVGLTQVEGAGNYVTPSDTNGLVVLTQLKPITVIFTLPEDNVPDVVARLKSGEPIPIEAYDRSDTRKLASGVLSTVDNQVDPTTGTFKLRAQFPNDDESLFPNQFVNIRMLLNVDRSAIVIPTSAIERGQPGTFVYVVKPDNTVTARTVTLGPTEGERVAIVKGLAAGENVVIEGADRLKEGVKVILQGAAGSGAHPARAGSQPPGSTGRHRRRQGGADGAGSGGAPQ